MAPTRWARRPLTPTRPPAKQSPASSAQTFDEVVFTKNATEAINLLAYAMGNAATAGPEAERFRVGPGDRIVVTEMEHHANLVPWQELARRTGAELVWLPLTDDGRLDLGDLDTVVNERTKVVSFVHQSNILGTVNPVSTIAARARAVGALVVLDACQSVPHMPFSVKDVDVDFVTFSGHKMLGPSGIGVLWGRRSLLEALPPFLTGGIDDRAGVHGTHDVRSAASALRGGYSAHLSGRRAPCRRSVSERARDGSSRGARAPVDRAPSRATRGAERRTGYRSVDSGRPGGAVSFVVDGIHPHDVGQVLDDRGVAVRVGHHCAWPVCRRYGVPATTRASFYVYNDTDDLDALVEGIVAAQSFFGVAP